MTAVASKTFTMGISEIKLGDIAQDGGMGQILAALGLTEEDSCEITFGEISEEDVNVEELDDPFEILKTAGKTTFAFNIVNPTVEGMALVMGGTGTAVDGGADTYEAPISLPTIEKSLQITPRKGFKFEAPRCSINATLTGGYGRKKKLMLRVAGTVLAPTKVNTGKFKLTRLVASQQN